ncbi:hypothetical protein [Paenibacillus swuensis]|uniref:hypothetical protein n=1 Tax=Paenibacillus swuensis TaxID=1178515 RepID=UPI000A83B35D|nr:hypothetical protein [Paenibacillus swuensis]
MSAERCYRCGHRPKEKEKFCTACGAPLLNRCSSDGGPLGDPCNKVNADSAVFCAHCGSYTNYYKIGMLHSLYGENKREERHDPEFRHFEHKFFRD